MDAGDPPPSQDAPARSRDRARGRPVLVLLTLLASAVFGTTAWVLTHTTTGIPAFIPYAFALATFLAAVLAILVGERLWRIWRASRDAGRSRLHGRLVAVLSVVTVVPAVVAFVLTGAVLQAFAQNFFLERMETSNQAALDITNTYFEGEADRNTVRLQRTAFSLVGAGQQGIGPERAPIAFRALLEQAAAAEGFSGLTVLGPDGRIIAAVGGKGGAPFALPPGAVLAGLQPSSPGSFNALDLDTLDTYYAATRLTGSGAILIAYRQERPAMTEKLLAVRAFRDETVTVRERIDDLDRAFAIGYGLLLVILLLTAVWTGLLVASGIVEPVKRLADAAGRVSKGDLTSRVTIRPREDELGELSRAFNEMTEQLQEQRSDLVAANDRADQRRRFIETVLSGVPSGVLNVDEGGRVVFANPFAAGLLDADREALPGQDVGALIPELAPLLQRAAGTPTGEATGQLEVDRAGTTRILNAQVVPEEAGEPGGASIVTLDDITELVSAQRNAAWGDVARRIAHEIKNPLTPIQLSAERLRRRYGRLVPEDDREVFDRCTDTIVRHVGDIGRMVSEFSSFARMPEPVVRPENLGEVAREAAFPATVAFPGVAFATELPDEPVMALCDGRLIGQAIGNLVKNAAEALTEHHTPEPKVTLQVGRKGAMCFVRILDNGPGLPAERHRLTEPYMTTRAKGTGLGLAIVRKATEDHGGSFSLRDRASGGAAATITLPAADAAASPTTEAQSAPELSEA